ncbi:MAG: LysR family transcriptional regulator [Eubacteriales bacterium]|nr:LysR family transcriptional regulator [Eubacteriales bacterium]
MAANLEYYRVFYYVVRCGSATRAAAALSLSQPAVSQSLKQLEQALGVKLFVRTARGILPTAEGRLLFSYVEKGYEQFQAGEKRLLQMRNLECGEITIGASDMTLRFFLLPYLERFHEKYPGVRFQITNGPTPATMALLKEGKIDFGVVSGPLESAPGLRLVPVRSLQDVFVVGRRFAEYVGIRQPLSLLERLPLITLDAETSSRRYVQRFLERRGVHIRPEFELSTSDMIVQFSLRNLGVGCVVRDFTKKELDSGELMELEFEESLPARHFLVAADEKGGKSLAAQELLRMLAPEDKGGDGK